MHLNRVFACFWAFGLVNNVLYVLILSAAVDLVGSSVPKGVVLLADVIPAFIIKLTAPFYIHKIPYHLRIFSLVVLSFLGMVIVALAESIFFKLCGVVLASASSGLGEITFLQLTHYFSKDSINGFSSGTGGAGLVGSFYFLVFTTWLGFSFRPVLLMSSLLPTIFLVVFFKFLPNNSYQPILSPESQDLDQPGVGASLSTITRIKALVVPYILPLTTVYIGEYIINQGISPTLLFDKKDIPFKEYRDTYVMYGTLYQIGVFISRSSAPFFRVYHLYIPAMLQTINLVLCILQSLYMIIPSIYPLFALMIYEGILGGLAYVNTYMLVSETVPFEDREFSMGAVGLSDSAGIVVAGLISLWLEPSLCKYQVDHGRPWCRY